MGTLVSAANAFILDGPEIPPGWEAPPTREDLYELFFSTCQRVSFAGLERGPTHFLFELGGALEPPEACAGFEANYDSIRPLISIWVDDEALADLLRGSLGMPVRLGQFSVVPTSPQPGVEAQEWRWREGSADESVMVAVFSGTAGDSAFTDRLVWHNGTAVTFLDLLEDRAVMNPSGPTSPGTLAEPMRWAERGWSAIVGLTSVWKDGDFTGDFYRFGDLACKEPLG
jgi:hypothetical protein